MRNARVSINNIEVGFLREVERGKKYIFEYDVNYVGLPISLSMPVQTKHFEFEKFPPFFDGLLPEGIQLEGLLKNNKLDRDDYFSQIIAVGADLVGAVTVKEVL